MCMVKSGNASYSILALDTGKGVTPMTSEAGEITDKLKDKKAEYEAIASSNSFVNLEDMDNKIITEQYMPSGSQAQAEVQRLRDQMAQMQASTVEQIAQHKVEAVAREAEQPRKYNELQLQLQNMMKMFQQSQNPPS
ncbi:5-azacytidine-induced 1 [Gossypium arboreum]|uniref:5-azacytidine-induced 1 n=1 Tax=Gossypium arboreum TaxID=29729 RepID=A0A0B0PX14_GOSAR|nr:5-azacytidine-induced 1 [Gossypium arboreum]